MNLQILDRSIGRLMQLSRAQVMLEHQRVHIHISQNNEGMTIVGGYSVNAILEQIGIASLEDIFNAMERARKRFTAWIFNIEG